MRSIQIFMIFSILTLASRHLFAQDTLFIPVNNEPINNDTQTSSVSYGLTDEEIAKRVERGMANTVPISVLMKWKEKQQKQTMPVAQPSLPIIQKNQSNIVTSVPVEKLNSQSVQLIEQPVYQQIEQPNKQQSLPVLTAPVTIKADSTLQKPTTVHVHVLPQTQTNEPTLTVTEPKSENAEATIINQNAIKPLQESKEIKDVKKPSLLQRMFKKDQ